jgi:hypothetical protein
MDSDYYYRRSRRRDSSRRWTWLHWFALVLLVLLAMPVLRAITGAATEVARQPVRPAPLDVVPAVAGRAVQDYATHMMDPVRQSMLRNAYVQSSAAHYRAPAPVGRQLAQNEQCVGGSIVHVDQVNGVPTYTQETDGAHPLACPQTQY